MRQPGFVWPDFLNLGIGRTAPRGAMGFAPRVALLPAGTIGTAFTKVRSAKSPQLVATYLLPLSAAIQGQAYQPVQPGGLTPNPYQN